ncbi:MAG: glycerophosphodiester phosphodiesterase [Pseudobdellovibrionaceae bacterium]
MKTFINSILFLLAITLSSIAGAEGPLLLLRSGPVFTAASAQPLVTASSTKEPAPKPLIIGHRGASGHRPEHTKAAYELAIDFGADYIEPDLVMTKDKVLIVRHENEISGTTNVAEKFPDRKTTKIVDGESITGWFAEDFTLKEIKTLKVKERLSQRSRAYDNQFEILTFKEVIDIAEMQSKEKKRPIGIYPETKHPTYFKSIGLPLEDALVAELKKAGWNDFESPVFIQSFEVTNLKELKKSTSVKLILLLGDADKKPYDFVSAKINQTYSDLMQPKGLKELKKFIYGIGPSKQWIVPQDKDGKIKLPTDLIVQAHAAGLQVHPYTFRSDKPFLSSDYKSAQDEYLQFFKLGADAVFSDFPDDAVAARKIFEQ